eukprot:2672678-Pyramimonas_sp.AAC.1
MEEEGGRQGTTLLQGSEPLNRGGYLSTHTRAVLSESGTRRRGRLTLPPPSTYLHPPASSPTNFLHDLLHPSSPLSWQRMLFRQLARELCTLASI